MSQFYDLNMTGQQLDERLDKVLTNEQAIATERERAEGVEATKANAADVYNKSEVYTKEQTNAEVAAERERAEGVEATKANAADVYNKSEVYTKQQTEAIIIAEAEVRGNADKDLQEQIDDVREETSELKLTASPELIQVGISNQVNLSATSSMAATSIVIKRGDTQIATGTGKTLSLIDEVTPNAEGNIDYKALFTLGSASREVAKRIKAVLPIIYGAGAVYTEAQGRKLATSPAGVYNFTVGTNGQFMFIIVPYTMTINRITMSGFDVPMLAPESEVIGGFSYKVYKTANAYDAGNYQLIVE